MSRSLSSLPGIRRRDAGPFVRQGLDSIDVVGSPIPPPTSQGVGLARQLVDALAATSALGGAVANHAINARMMMERAELRAERKAAKLEREEEKARQFQRGLGVRYAKADAPQLLQDIVENKITTPEGLGFDVFADSLIAERVPDGVGDGYREGYSDHLRGSLVQALVRQDAAAREKVAAESLALLMENAVVADSPAAMREQVDAAGVAFPQLTESERLGRIVLPAAEAAARAGDRARVLAAFEVLGERFPAERQRVEADLVRAEGQRRQRRAVEFENIVSGFYIDGRPFEEIRKNILAARGDVDDSQIESKLREVDAREAAAMREANAAKLEAENAATRAELLGRVMTGAMRADETFGLAMVPETGYRWTDSAGKEHRLSRDEVVREATEGAFERIKAESRSPEEAFTKQAAFLSLNGVTHDPWKQVLHSGFTSGATAFQRRAENGDVAPLPKALEHGYELWKKLDAANPAVAALHTDGDAATFYTLAQLAERYTDAGDPKAALFRASQVRGDAVMRGDIVQRVLRRDVDAAVSWARGAINAEDVREETVRLAGLLTRAPGLAPEVALNEAARLVKANYTMINGAAVYTRDRHVPANIEALSSRIAETYAAAHGEAEGLRARDLTLAPGRTPGTWVLTRKGTASPVDQWQTDGLFTTADLMRMNREDAKRAAADRAAKLEQWQDENAEVLQQIEALRRREADLEDWLQNTTSDDLNSIRQSISATRAEIARLRAAAARPPEGTP